MPACEKCWKDSGGIFEEYKRLIAIRNCTPEEMAGDDAGVCPECLRKTVHQHVHICMVHDCYNVTGEVK